MHVCVLCTRVPWPCSLSQENAMPLSARDTMERMRSTTFCVAPTGDSDGFTQRFYYILAAGCIPVGLDTGWAQAQG